MEMVDWLAEVGVPAKRQRLDVGDYSTYDSFGELVLITRKASDLCTSVNDGHFKDEVERCINSLKSYGGGSLWWILEGVWAPAYPGGKGGLSYFKRQGVDWYRKGAMYGNAASSLAGMQVSAQSSGVGFLWTPDLAGTVTMLAALANRAAEGWPTHFTTRVGRRPLKWSKDGRVQNLMGLWPRLTERQAMALLDKFGSVGNVLRVAMTDPVFLQEVKGVGKQSVQNLTTVLA